MASISAGRAVGTITSGTFYKMVALVTVGTFLSTFAQNWLRDEVYDVQMPMGDAVYSLAVIFAVRLVLKGRNSMLVAAGAGTGILVAAMDEFDML